MPLPRTTDPTDDVVSFCFPEQARAIAGSLPSISKIGAVVRMALGRLLLPAVGGLQSSLAADDLYSAPIVRQF